MVRSLTKRGLPKPFAIALATLLALYFVPLGALPAHAAEPSKDISINIEGCRLEDDGTCFWIEGNLGKNWSELDLVPHRFNLGNGGDEAETFRIIAGGDYKYQGKTGYDYFTAPTVTAGNCQVSVVNANEVSPTGVANGTDTAIGNLLEITMPAGGECTITWSQRLAIGARQFSGSNLQTRVYSETWGQEGQKTVPLPVKEISPQKIEKTASATNTRGYTWSVSKSSQTESETLDSCSTTANQASVSYTVSWTRAANEAADVGVVSGKITLTNPANRALVATVTDTVKAGASVVGTATFTNQTVPANGTKEIPYSIELSGGAGSNLTNTASAVYQDPDRPGQSLDPLNVTVAVPVEVKTVDGPSSTAKLTDEETIGSPLAFKITSPSEYAMSSFAGSNTFTKDLAGGGSLTLSKTVKAPTPFNGTVDLVNKVSLTPGGTQEALTSTVTIPVTVTAAPPQLKFVKKVDIAPTTDATFTFHVRAKDAQGEPTGPTYTVEVTVPAGETSASSGYQTVAPSQHGYLYTETAASGYTGVDGAVKALALCEDATETVNNVRDLGKIKIEKKLVGDPAGASTSFVAHVDCPGEGYDQDVALNSGNGWIGLTGNIPTGTQCTVTEKDVPTGWTLKGITPEVVSVSLGTPYAVTATITNERLLGEVTVNKLLEGAVAGASTEFTVELDCDVNAYDRTVVLNAGNSWSRSYDIPSGVTCAVTEPTVPAGWELKGISPSGEFTVGAGQTVTVDVTNKRQQGGVVINKIIEGDPVGTSTDFTVLLDCDGTDYDRTVHLKKSNDWTATYDGIPAGVECQVTEPDVPEGWELETITPEGTFVIGSESRVVVDVTNDREDGDITISKKVEGPVAGASTDFTVKLDCEGTAYDATVVLTEANGWSQTIEDVPTLLDCQVTEPNVPAGWQLSSITPAGMFQSDHDEVVTVTVTNKRQVGAVKIAKAVVGDVAGASTEFTVDLDCDGTAYDRTAVALNEANGWTATFGGIPTLVECQVSEPTVPEGWDLTSIAPAGKFTVGSSATVVVTVTNERRVGAVVVHKSVVGDVAGASTEFTVTLDCDGTAYDRSLVLNEGNSWTVFAMGIPTGVSCQVTEPAVPAGWSLISVTPAGSFVVDDVERAVAVDVVNSRDVGSVEVKKVVVGDVAGASTDFSVLLDCDGSAYDKTLALTAASSWTARVDNIPTLVQCRVTEPTVPAGWVLTSVSPPGKFAVQKGTVAAVTVTNTRTTGVITVAKVLDGAANGAATTFTFDVDCVGTAYDQSVVVNVASGTSATGTTGQIPTGLVCTVTERATPDWKLTTTVPAGGAVAVGSTVTFTNQRLQGTLNILKEVSPVAGEGVVVEIGDTLTYTLTVSATGEQRQPNVVVTDYVPGFDPERDESGSTTYVPGSATCVGAGTCSVTEPGTDGLITWSLGEMAAGTTRQVTFQVVIDPVVGEAGTSVAVDILNAGAVQSDRTPRTPSNEVVTPVTAVFPVKEGKPPAPAPLPRTGAVADPAVLAMSALGLLGLGLLLVAAARRRHPAPRKVG
ncbi:MAG TPA: DUF5979 domain-containing protein [Actinomycetes bacterium]|nr:DUF5979 domain-containing protein [Actinomycetes bacterium]